MTSTDLTPPTQAPPPRWATAQPWVSTVLRLGVAGVALAAGLAKLTDIPAAVRAVRAYELLPELLVRPVAIGLPVIEILVGVLLLTGLLTRYAAVVFGLLMLVFIAGIASVWARGLSIDCGCFGGGGATDASLTAYPLEIARDTLFLAGAAVLVRWPRSRFSLDSALGLVDPA
ncbi:MAG: DoxX family membrane protein [Cellulomonadaceae bacterium]|nr:DoxX family membrane protein [Cellulomonadaceae bacterium]